MTPPPVPPDPLQSESIGEFISSMNRETSLRVTEIDRTLSGSAAGAFGLVAGPAGAFLRAWIGRGGWRRGRRGFVGAVLCAFSELSLRAKLWEYRSAPGTGKPPVDEEGIRSMELRYGP